MVTFQKAEENAIPEAQPRNPEPRKNRTERDRETENRNADRQDLDLNVLLDNMFSTRPQLRKPARTPSRGCG
ncbi:hypothetical protein ACFWFQ_36400, partial [Nocardia salmonicida]|uniref:hypothetical protein n=1 Tax=Nocardia salmonicida TaxID=53431 RepID=UPI00364F9D33